jgi:hypothetical protein
MEEQRDRYLGRTSDATSNPYVPPEKNLDFIGDFF